jgi:putative PIN family toxin of toxin-antitoxin system
MRYLIDTNVLVSALLSKRGASHQILRRALSGELPIIMQHKLLWEYRDVTARPDLASRFALNADEVTRLIARIAHIAYEIPVRYLWRPNLRDEGDNFVLEIAVAAAPCTIVTHNIGDFRSGELRFPDLPILTPQALLVRLNH